MNYLNLKPLNTVYLGDNKSVKWQYVRDFNGLAQIRRKDLFGVVLRWVSFQSLTKA